MFMTWIDGHDMEVIEVDGVRAITSVARRQLLIFV
jgi:hypothetical protein